MPHELVAFYLFSTGDIGVFPVFLSSKAHATKEQCEGGLLDLDDFPRIKGIVWVAIDWAIPPVDLFQFKKLAYLPCIPSSGRFACFLSDVASTVPTDTSDGRKMVPISLF